MGSSPAHRRKRMTFPYCLAGVTESILSASNQNKGRSSRVRGQRRQRGRNRAGAVGTYFGDAWSLAKRTAVGLNEIRKLINIETKVIETTATNTGFNQTPNITGLSTVVQGLDYAQRVGDSIKLQRLEIRYRVFLNTLGVTTVVRVIVFRDLDGYGTAPGGSDILSVTGTAIAPLSPKNYLNADRFSILYDRLETIDNTGPKTFSDVLTMPHEGHVKYLGPSASASSNGKGSVYILFVSDESTNTPTFAFQSRVYFTDD